MGRVDLRQISGRLRFVQLGSILAPIQGGQNQAGNRRYTLQNQQIALGDLKRLRSTIVSRESETGREVQNL